MQLMLDEDLVGECVAFFLEGLMHESVIFLPELVESLMVLR